MTLIGVEKESKEPKAGSWILTHVDDGDPKLEELLDTGFEPFSVQMVMKVNRLTQQGEPGFIVFLKKQVKE
jgi:hypothetical protein